MKNCYHSEFTYNIWTFEYILNMYNICTFEYVLWITISHVVKFAVLIGLFNYTVQGNYYFIETKLL